MIGRNQNSSIPLAQTANPQRAVPDGTGRPVSVGGREFNLPRTMSGRAGEIGGGEGNCPLWDGQIIDATFPLV
jgi:hypothetical protein